MDQLISFQKVKDRKKDEFDRRRLDVEASYACLEHCLEFIELNDLKELRDVKAMMRSTMKSLVDIRKDGYRL